MEQKILDLLYRSFDARLTPEEQQQLDEALMNSQDLREEKKRIAALRETVSDSGKLSFQPFFADRVMQRINREKMKPEKVEDFFNSLIWSFRRVALAGTIVILFLLATNFVRGDRLSLTSLIAMPQFTIEDTWVLNDLIEGELQ